MADADIRKELRLLRGEALALKKAYEAEQDLLQASIRKLRFNCPHNDMTKCHGGQYERHYNHCNVCGADIDC